MHTLGLTPGTIKEFEGSTLFSCSGTVKKETTLEHEDANIDHLVHVGSMCYCRGGVQEDW